MNVQKEVIIKLNESEAFLLRQFISYNKECDDSFDASTEDERLANEFAIKLALAL